MPQTPLLDNSERARQAILIFTAQLIATGLYIMTGLIALFYFQRVPDYEYDSESLPYEEIAHGISGLLMTVINILGIVYFLRWFRRAYANLERVGENLAYSEGWAVGAWFVPLLNLWRPYQIMKEIWYKTRQVYGTVINDDHQFIKGWWLVFILKTFFDRVAARLSWRATTLSELKYATEVGLISSVIDLGALFLTIYVIRKIAKQEEGLAIAMQLQTVGQQPEPPVDGEDESSY